MADLKFDHAGTPEPPALPVASSSDVEPLGSAGLVNQGSKGTAALVGPVYSDLAAATQAEALDKRHSDWTSLMSGHTPAGGSSTDGGY